MTWPIDVVSENAILYEGWDPRTIMHSSNVISRCSFYFFKEVDIWLVGDSCLLHCLYKIFRLSETSSLALIVPSRQYYNLIRLIRIAPE